MPINEYYKGSGEEVLAGMKKTYGDAPTAKRVFYATANKQNMNPKKQSKTQRKKGIKQ